MPQKLDSETTPLYPKPSITVEVVEPDPDDKSSWSMKYTKESVSKSKAPIGIAMGEKKREKNQKEGTCEELFDSIDEIPVDCWDYVMNPTAGCSWYFFYFGGVFGGVALYLYFAGAHIVFKYLYVYLAGTLCFIGGLAAFESKSMIKTQKDTSYTELVGHEVKEFMSYLGVLEPQIRTHVELVTQRVDLIHQERRTFEANLSDMVRAEDEFEEEVANLKVGQNLLVPKCENLVKANAELDSDICNLQTQIKLLQKTKDELEEWVCDLETRAANFSELRREIFGIVNSEDNLNFIDYLDSVNAAYEEYNDLIERSECVNLHQKVLTANRNGGDGLNKQQFTRFKCNLDNKMKAIMEHNHWSWETLSNGSERIQQHRVETMIEDMLEAANPKPKKNIDIRNGMHSNASLPVLIL